MLDFPKGTSRINISNNALGPYIEHFYPHLGISELILNDNNIGSNIKKLYLQENIRILSLNNNNLGPYLKDLKLKNSIEKLYLIGNNIGQYVNNLKSSDKIPLVLPASVKHVDLSGNDISSHARDLFAERYPNVWFFFGSDANDAAGNAYLHKFPSLFLTDDSLTDVPKRMEFFSLSKVDMEQNLLCLTDLVVSDGVQVVVLADNNLGEYINSLDAHDETCFPELPLSVKYIDLTGNAISLYMQGRFREKYPNVRFAF